MHNLSALSLRKKILSKEITALEVTDYFLKRIEKYDPKIKAFLTVFKDKARVKAQEIDDKISQNLPVGKLAGIPIAIKDNMHIEGEITTCASKFLENYTAPFDSTLVRYLEEEGAIILGKTNLDEFAMGSSNEKSAFFPTRNPWDLNCTPGGSSGGSAAAVAARLVPIAFGSDTGGSIRQPAALCGTIGFKPSYGRISRYGLVAFGSSFDQIGPLANYIEDVALIMEVVGKNCNYDSTCLSLPAEGYLEHLKQDLKDLTIGVPWNFLEGVSEPILKNFKESVETAKKLGATIVDIDLNILKYSLPVYYILATAEASTNLARFDGIRYGKRSQNAKTLNEVFDKSRKEGFGDEVKKRIMLGTYVLSAGYEKALYQKAQKVRHLIISHYQKAFEKCDIVLLPTSPTPAFPLGSIQDPVEMYKQDLFTISANIAGLPAISIPSGFSEEKPLGLQLIGPQLHDTFIIGYSNAIINAFNQKFMPTEFEKESSK